MSGSNVTAKELYARFHQLKVELEELPDIVHDRREKVEQLLETVPPWSHYYELPWKQTLGLFLVLSGLDQAVIEASKQENPNMAFFAYFDKNPDPINDDEYTDEDKSVFISIFMSILHQMKSLSILSQPLSEIVVKAKTDDNALFDAVLIDRTVVACPSIARRIQIAQLQGDESFMNKLAKSITQTRPRRPNSEYDDLRYMLEAVDEIKEYEGISQREKYDLLAVDLELYDVDGKSDPFSGFKRLIERRDKRKAT